MFPRSHLSILFCSGSPRWPTWMSLLLKSKSNSEAAHIACLEARLTSSMEFQLKEALVDCSGYWAVFRHLLHRESSDTASTVLMLSQETNKLHSRLLILSAFWGLTFSCTDFLIHDINSIAISCKPWFDHTEIY